MEETGIFWAQEALWVSTLDFLSRIVHSSSAWGKICPGVHVEIGEMQKKTYFLLWMPRENLNEQIILGEVHLGMGFKAKAGCNLCPHSLKQWFSA